MTNGTADVDVLIVGAGPAGAAAAIELCRRGVSRVLLAGPESGPGHDVFLSAAAEQSLASLGIEPSARPIGSIRMCLGGEGHVLPDATAAVADHGELTRRLVKAAREAGARWSPGMVTGVVRQADGVHRADVAGRTVRARHLIVASGSGNGGPGTGVVCVQRYTGAELTGQAVLALPAPSGIDATENPSCAWAVPGTEPGTVTFGVARTGRNDPEELLRSARSILAAADPRLAAAVPDGPPISGPASSSFSPAGAVSDGRLLVGDAAGLVNPFTGEGLSYAVHSGLLAAQAIARHADDPAAAERGYRRRLERTFVGYFETARHAAQRYHLAWRVLVSTAGSSRPVFAKVRRAVLLPEGFSGLGSADRMPLGPSELALLAPFLMACDEVAISTVRTEWPFIARLLIAGESGADQRIRPAASFLGALLAGGRPPEITRATVAAAIELATLGTLTFLGPMPRRPEPGRVVDWSLTSSVLAGDFLLSHANRLVAESAPEVSWAFADWLAELSALRSACVHPDHTVPARAVFAALMAFPARVGGQLGGASPSVVRALRTYGEQCGHVFLHVEDLLALQRRRTRLDTDLRTMLAGRISALPDLLPDAGDLTEPSTESLEATTQAGRCAYHDALSALEDVPHAPAAHLLTGFLNALAAPLSADRQVAAGATRDSGRAAAACRMA